MQSTLTEGLLWYVVFVLSTSCHEAGHAWSALKLGDDTAARGGQVSLNPWPHIRREPFGMVVMPLLSWFSAGWLIGWASAPYDPAWARQWPRRVALMALAGPAANLLLVLGAALLIRVGVEWNILTAPVSPDSMHLADAITAGPWDTVAKILSVTLSLNLLLFVFNLIPLPPLDGSSVPLLFLPPALAEKYTAVFRNPMLQIVGMLVISRLLSPLFPVLLLNVVRILFPTVRYN